MDPMMRKKLKNLWLLIMSVENLIRLGAINRTSRGKINFLACLGAIKNPKGMNTRCRPMFRNQKRKKFDQITGGLVRNPKYQAS